MIRSAGFAFGLAFSAAVPAAAQAACGTHDAQAAAIQPEFDAAFALMSDGKVTEGIALLPRLEPLLAALPAQMPAPEACGGKVLVFDPHQFDSFQALRAAGKPVPGYATEAEFEYRELPFASLAYAVGWLTYEQGDFPKALESYQKGLAIAPNDHDLSNEVLATLLQLKQGADIVAFADRFLATDTDSTAEERSNMILSKGLGLWMQNDLDGARAAADQALALWPDSPNGLEFRKNLAPGS